MDIFLSYPPTVPWDFLAAGEINSSCMFFISFGKMGQYFSDLTPTLESKTMAELLLSRYIAPTDTLVVWQNLKGAKCMVLMDWTARDPS